MRLRRLDLTRYGKFTGHSIDFGVCKPGAPDLHIIYGPNEAGKSTLFAAWLDLLYGVPAQSPYNFLHPYATMRIGGALELSGSVREFARIKRAQNTLLDGHDRAVAENTILGELGGIDRTAYRTMFSLDDDTLEEGGESILKAKGDLGQLLFSASSGLADLSRKIGELQEGADAFFRSQTRSGELHEMMKRLTQLKQDRDQIDTQAAKHAQLSDRYRSSKTRYDEAIRVGAQKQARGNEIQALLSARPRLAKLRSFRSELEPLNILPDAPREWANDLPALQADEIRLETQIQANNEDIARLEVAVAAVLVDETARCLAAKLEETAPLRARHITAANDLPERQEKLRELKFASSALLRQIDREDEAEPQRLLFKAATAERLRNLIEAHSGKETAYNKAAEELSEARHHVNDAAAKLASAGAADPALRNAGQETLYGALREAHAALRASDHGARLRLAERTCAERQAVLDDRITALAPWQGRADDLVAMPIPSSALLQQWRGGQDAIRKRLERHAAEMERLTSERRRLSAEQDAACSVTGLTTDPQAVAVRTQRDHIWKEHRSCLDATTADRFEDALRRDDEVTAQRFGHISELAELHACVKALKIAESDLARAEELHAEALGEAQSLARAIAEAIRGVSPELPSEWELPQFEAWLSRCDKALEARDGLRAAEQDRAQAQRDARSLKDRLASALGALQVSSLQNAAEEELARLAQTTLEREAELKRLHETWEERQRDVSARERALSCAEADMQHWQDAWQNACATCWLGESGGMPTIADVRGVLPIITELAGTLKEMASLSGRIDKMQSDQVAFCTAMTALATELRLAPVEASAITELARQIEERIREAQAAHSHKVLELERLDAARGVSKKLAADKSTFEHRKQKMTAFFGVPTLAEVAAALGRIAERDNLRQRAGELEQDILDTLRLVRLEDAEQALELVDQSALEAEHAEIAVQAKALEEDAREAYAEYKQATAEIESIGGDARVAEIEEQRRTLVLEIEDSARRYLRLRAGIAATEKALRLYRERHLSSMMAQASKALRIISRGAYTGLTTQPGKDSEILIAIAADKTSKLATEMSKGTRFQLYLALRVAGYFEFVSARNPVPFIADDIMETFDDFRAEEAFRLFAEMAGAGQVIYLTHHRHLCDIARQVCPTVTLHDLTESAAANDQRLEHVDELNRQIERSQAG